MATVGARVGARAMVARAAAARVRAVAVRVAVRVVAVAARAAAARVVAVAVRVVAVVVRLGAAAAALGKLRLCQRRHCRSPLARSRRCLQSYRHLAPGWEIGNVRDNNGGHIANPK